MQGSESDIPFMPTVNIPNSILPINNNPNHLIREIYNEFQNGDGGRTTNNKKNHIQNTNTM